MPTPEQTPNPEFSDESLATSFYASEELENASFSSIAATVSPQILSKVTRLFNASLEDIINELFQNARRAGATYVEVSLNDLGYLCVQDDGSGIENPQTLLSLGQSDWNTSIVESEDPAGMGFFSLAHRGATISSQNWQVQLEPEHFAGAAIAITRPIETQEGTRIEFPLTANELDRVQPHIEKAAQYYPLAVGFDGRALAQQDFLRDALLIKEWRGLRLGVSADHRWRDRSGDGTLNFYGLTVNLPLPTLSCNDMTLRVRVDVENAPDLKLVLPARKEVVQDEFFADLKTELRRALYETVALLEHHDLPYVRWLEARSFGIELPPARSQLHPFTPRITDHISGGSYAPAQFIDPTAMLVEGGNLQAHEQQILARALNAADLPYTLLSTDDRYRGYPWYDALPKLSPARIEIAIGDRTFSPDEFGEMYGLEDNVIVDSITAIVTQTQPGTPDRELRLPLDVGFGEFDDASYILSLEEVTLAIARHHSLAPQELADLLEASFYAPSEESDADSYETQRENFQEEAQERAIRALLSEQAALKARIEMIIDRHLRWVIPSNMRIELRVLPHIEDENFSLHRSVEIVDVTSSELSSEG